MTNVRELRGGRRYPTTRKSADIGPAGGPTLGNYLQRGAEPAARMIEQLGNLLEIHEEILAGLPDSPERRVVEKDCDSLRETLRGVRSRIDRMR